MHLFPGLRMNTAAATTDKVELPVLNKHDVELWVLRLDNIHPVISGNKWFKLKYHLQQAQQNKAEGLLTWGGAYSNHIIALACAARELGWKSTGIIRGEQAPVLSHTLQQALDYGMQLEFVSRDAYKNKTTAEYPSYYQVPEGGAGPLGIKGSREILDLTQKERFTHILCAIGTATMYQGLLSSALSGQQVIGVPVLKGGAKLSFNDIQSGYHFGGYARKSDALLAFMNHFYRQTHIPTDFVYTGKLLFATLDLVEKGHFPAGSRLLAVHSGGLQGNNSLPRGTLQF